METEGCKCVECSGSCLCSICDAPCIGEGCENKQEDNR